MYIYVGPEAPILLCVGPLDKGPQGIPGNPNPGKIVGKIIGKIIGEIIGETICDYYYYFIIYIYNYIYI